VIENLVKFSHEKDIRMKTPTPDRPPSLKTPTPALHVQTESTAGRKEVREELHHTSAPRESKRANERNPGHKKK
jgi:hypothetical protein